MKTYKREDIAKMTIPNIKALVRKHNLHTNYIKNYSRLRKAELIDKFMEHYKKSPPVETKEEPKRARPVSPSGPAKKPAVPMKRKKKGNKPKMTRFDKAMGVDKPLYEEGVEKGAKKQFEKRYGSSEDAKFLKNLQTDMETDKGRGKRRKKKIQNPDFVYDKANPKKKRGRPKKKKD